ncbi:hypothetical protein BDI4_40109 [Burkholderia diffusa]|uniref:hypothetical protein n=1 Tax=Burkholderia diffusa TaxID=488732 RepID=UPI001CB57855|nr:hypothetical protein BDI4_40109 [Burkholderia diffusa]
MPEIPARRISCVDAGLQQTSCAKRIGVLLLLTDVLRDYGILTAGFVSTDARRGWRVLGVRRDAGGRHRTCERAADASTSWIVSLAGFVESKAANVPTGRAIDHRSILLSIGVTGIWRGQRA